MKIIFCTFLLCITEDNVSVFGQSVPLDGIGGKSIEFPTKVETSGSLMYGSKIIGSVLSKKLLALEDLEYKGRVRWHNSTGYFSLSGLRLNDSGVYNVKNDRQKSVSFSLTVRKYNVNVSKPHVSITHNEYPCTIECTAERGTEATLSWYRKGEKKSLVSSRVESAPHLHLPAPVERSGTYTCEAKNSVSNETSDPLTVGDHCTVFGQSVELNGIVGQSVKFPAAVKKGDGFLMYGTLTIGDVTSRIFRTSRDVNYRDRVQWDSSTGLFSLSGLKMEDSGEYKVQNTDPNTIITVFQLNVYIPVSKPHVSVTQNEYPCTVECTAERGTEVTLSWYREGEKKSFASSRVASAPHLHLPHSVESGTYTCEAKNSVSNEKASITVGDHCTAPTSSSTIAAIIIAAVAVPIAVVFTVLYCYIIRRRQAVRTLRRVKKLLDNVDLHAYDETVPPDAVRPFILVKNLLDNVNLHAYAVRTLIQVKKILHNVDPFECDETVPQNAVRTFIQVKQLLDNVDPHVCGFKRKRRDYIISNSPSSDRMRFPIGHLGDAVQPVPQSGETRLELSPDARRTLIQD